MKRIFAVVLLCAMLFTTLAIGGAGNVATPSVLDADTYPQENTVAYQNVSGATDFTPTEITGYQGRTELAADYSLYESGASESVFRNLYNAMGEDKVIKITSAKELASFFVCLNAVKTVNKGDNPYATNETSMPKYDFAGVTVKLTKDIVLNPVDANGNLTKTYAMTQIAGNMTRYFNGTFDGDGHVVSGWYQQATSNNRSMFGPFVGATIKNVAFINCYMDAYNEPHEKSTTDTPEKTSAMLSVKAYGKNTIENVYIGADHDGGKDKLGALIGELTSNTELNVKNTTVDITYGAGGHNPAGSMIGGMVGYVAGTASVTMDNCIANCNLTATAGLTTLAKAATATMIDDNGDSVADKDDFGRSMYLVDIADYTVAEYAGTSAKTLAENVAYGYGGVIGYSTGTLNLSNCKATGSITAAGQGVGGIVGRLYNSYVNSLTNCQNELVLTASDTVYVPYLYTKANAYYIKSGEEYVPASFTGISTQNVKTSLGNVSFNTGWGGIVGDLWGGKTTNLTQCINKANITSAQAVAGIVGDKTGAMVATFDSCVNEATAIVTAKTNGAGGMLGQKGNTAKMTFTNCQNKGDVKVSNGANAGGMMGHMTQGPIVVENFTNSGDVYAKTGVAGGMIGCAQGSAADRTIDLTGCVNAGVISGGNNIGGMVGYKSAICPLTITDCKNLSTGTVDSTGTNAGGIIGLSGNEASDGKVLITGSSNEAHIEATSEVGGIVGYAKALTDLQSCVNKGTLSGGNDIGGMVGYKTETSALNIAKCQNLSTGTVASTGTYAGGIIGRAGESETNGAVTITGSVNEAAIQASSELAGIVGRVKTSAITIDNCMNKGAICTNKAFTSGTNNGAWTGGIIGYAVGKLTDLIDSVTITNTKNLGLVTGNRCTGGFIGYAQYVAKLNMENCYSMGDITLHVVTNSNPYCGGLIGRAGQCGELTIKKCTVGANITLNTDIPKSKNAVKVYVGGLAGSLDRSASNNGTVDYVGEGLDATFGNFVFENNTVKVDGITTNTLEWHDDETYTETVEGQTVTKNYATGVVVLDALCAHHGSAATMVPEFEQTTLVSATGKVPSEVGVFDWDNGNSKNDDDDATDTKVIKRLIAPIGVQWLENDNGSYNLRYVFAVDGLQPTDVAMGFVVERLNFADGGKAPTVDAVTTYCRYIYKTLKGETETYHVEDYGVEYFFTLEIGNVPAELIDTTSGRPMVKNTDINITPFVHSGAVTYNASNRTNNATASITKTESVLWDNRQNFYQNDFSKTLPDAFANAESIMPQIDWHGADHFGGIDPNTGEKYATGVTADFGCVSAQNTATTYVDLTNSCTGAEEGHICDMVANTVRAQKIGGYYHYYFQGDNDPNSKSATPYSDFETTYFSLKVTVEEDAMYDFCFFVRLKDSGERIVRLQIDDQEYDDQSVLVWDAADQAKAIDSTSTVGAYLTGYSAYLTKGTHTLTFRWANDVNGFNTGSAWHFRNIYVTKAA